MRIDRYNGNTLRRYHIWGGSIAIVRRDPDGDRWTGYIYGHLPHLSPVHMDAKAIAAQVRSFREWEREKAPPTTFFYEHWRHGGWYTNVRYSSGACGCVSRNYEDRKWRIACDPRPFEEQPTFKSRDDAARAEWFLAHGKTPQPAKEFAS